jgi:hypothetical protein
MRVQQSGVAIRRQPAGEIAELDADEGNANERQRLRGIEGQAAAQVYERRVVPTGVGQGATQFSVRSRIIRRDFERLAERPRGTRGVALGTIGRRPSDEHPDPTPSDCDLAGPQRTEAAVEPLSLDGIVAASEVQACECERSDIVIQALGHTLESLGDRWWKRRHVRLEVANEEVREPSEASHLVVSGRAEDKRRGACRIAKRE